MASKVFAVLSILILALLLSGFTYIQANEIPADNMHFDAEYVYVCIILDDIHDLKVSYSSAGTIEELAAAAHARFAVNGVYWNYENNAKQIVFNGELVNEAAQPYVHDYCVITDDGVMEIYAAADLDQIPQDAWQVWSFGPALVHDGAAAHFDDCWKQDLVDWSHPRTAIGYFSPNHFCFVTVAGRTPGNRGAYLEELADFFLLIGCEEAYNLDGGGSSHIWFEGEELGTPSEDRVIPEIIYIGE